MSLSRTVTCASVGLKLAAGFFTLVVLAVVIAVTASIALKGYAVRSLIVAGASSIESYLLDARTEEKNFQIRKEQRYIDAAKERANLILESAAQYKRLLDQFQANIDESAAVLDPIEGQLVELQEISLAA